MLYYRLKFTKDVFGITKENTFKLYIGKSQTPENVAYPNIKGNIQIILPYEGGQSVLEKKFGKDKAYGLRKELEPILNDMQNDILIVPDKRQQTSIHQDKDPRNDCAITIRNGLYLKLH